MNIVIFTLTILALFLLFIEVIKKFQFKKIGAFKERYVTLTISFELHYLAALIALCICAWHLAQLYLLYFR